MWLGIVSLLGVAQFWSLAADLHSRHAGERLFGVIAIGGSAGAIVGAQLARLLIKPIGIFGLMGIGGGAVRDRAGGGGAWSSATTAARRRCPSTPPPPRPAPGGRSRWCCATATCC